MKIVKKLCILFVLWFCMLRDVLGKIPNPYKVLGVLQTANDDQIKEGFKRRSKKYHPDRNKTDPRAKQKFQKIVNAYELLKDPERRRIYDMTGDDSTQQGGGGNPYGFNGGGINMEDLFAGFGGFGGGGFGGGQRQGQGGRRTTYTFSFNGGEGMRFQF